MMEVQIMQDEDPEELQIEKVSNSAAPQETSESYLNGEESSQFTSHILTGGDESDSGFAPEYLLTTERRSPNHGVPYSQQVDKTEHSDGGDGNEILQSVSQPTEGQQQQIITIIQESVEDNGMDVEEDVSKEMLKRFVINAEGIHPSIRPLDAILNTEESDLNKTNERENLKLDQSGHQHVVIFSTGSSTIPPQSPGGENQKLTITLVPDEESTYPDMLGPQEDGSGTSSLKLSEQRKEKSIGLDMTFEVVAELEAPNGQIVMREITTQTCPPKKRQPRKRKIKDPTKGETDETGDADLDGESTKRFKCTKCNLRFTNRETCEVHMRCHVPMSKNYECCFCDYKDTKWTKMHQHLFKHGIKKPHNCLQCSFSCRSKSDLTAHMTVHSNVKQFSCNKCNRMFKHRRNLVAHQRTCQGLDESGRPQPIEGLEKFTCNVCNQKLSSKKNLEKHMEIHLNLKPFVCDKCGHATRLKESLIMHKRLHTGEKPFKCEFCDYATPDKSSLRRHKRMHTNDRPYKCRYCSYRCIQKHCLDTHIRRKHTGEQFVCGLCHYATHDRYGLNQHFKRHQMADGSFVHEIEIVDDEKRTERLLNLNPPSTSTTYIALPSGAVLKSTNTGRNTVIEESVKKPSENSTTVRIPLQGKLHAQGGIAGVTDTALSSTVEPVNAENEKQEVTVEMGQLEASLLEQIQQPGDVIFVQPTGEILIRRQDGHLLVIQRQDIEEDEPNEGAGEGTASEYLTAVPPSEISGAIEDRRKQLANPEENPDCVELPIPRNEGAE